MLLTFFLIFFLNACYSYPTPTNMTLYNNTHFSKLFFFLEPPLSYTLLMQTNSDRNRPFDLWLSRVWTQDPAGIQRLALPFQLARQLSSPGHISKPFNLTNQIGGLQLTTRLIVYLNRSIFVTSRKFKGCEVMVKKRVRNVNIYFLTFLISH